MKSWRLVRVRAVGTGGRSVGHGRTARVDFIWGADEASAMTPPETASKFLLRHRVRVALQLGLALALLVLGIGNLTDTITWTLPPVVYLLAGVALFGYGVAQLRRD